MQATDTRPWNWLLSSLRYGDEVGFTYEEVLAAGVDAARLVRERLLEYGQDRYVPPDCEHRCHPAFDYESRKAEGLVGVACPTEAMCLYGFMWVKRTEVETLVLRATKVFAALAPRNGLKPLGIQVPVPF